MNPMPTGLTLDSVGKRTIEQQNDAKEERGEERREWHVRINRKINKESESVLLAFATVIIIVIYSRS